VVKIAALVPAIGKTAASVPPIAHPMALMPAGPAAVAAVVTSATRAEATQASSEPSFLKGEGRISQNVRPSVTLSGLA